MDETPMPAKPLRAGVIGLGIGSAHCDAYLKSPDADLVAICDSNETRLKQLAAKYVVPHYTDYRQMLAESNLDIVSICVPNALHAESTVAALEAGVHVLCEKPLAPSIVEVRDMIKAAKLNNKRLMVAYNHRYRADVFWIKRMIEDGKLGQIYHIDAWWRRETGIPGAGWFGNRQLAGGGALIDLGVHVLDLALWLLGFPEVKTVSGQTRTHFGQRGLKVWGHPRWISDPNGETVFDVDDGAVGFIRLQGGASLMLQATWAENRQPQDDLIRLEIQGTEGTAILNIANYRRDDTLRFYAEMAGQPVTVTPSVRWNDVYGHEALITDVLNSLHAGTPSPTDAMQGFAAVRIIEAIYHSTQTGHEVAFEQVPDMMA